MMPTTSLLTRSALPLLGQQMMTCRYFMQRPTAGHISYLFAKTSVDNNTQHLSCPTLLILARTRARKKAVQDI